MPNPKTDKTLTLTVITPDGEPTAISCDSVRLCVRDGQNGNGGSYGIRRGHAAATFVLDRAVLTAYLAGETVWQAKVAGGFAETDGTAVTVVTESVEE